MRKKLALVSVAALLVAIAGCGDSTHGEQITLKFTEASGEAESSFGPIGKVSRGQAAPGTGFAFSSPLLDSAKKEVGEISAMCIATHPSSLDALKGTCSGTAIVPGGDLALNAGGKLSNGASGSIVGGNGKYAGATGTFTSKGSGGEGSPNTDTFHIILP
jgi:hypothetical protein